MHFAFLNPDNWALGHGSPRVSETRGLRAEQSITAAPSLQRAAVPGELSCSSQMFLAFIKCQKLKCFALVTAFCQTCFSFFGLKPHMNLGLDQAELQVLLKKIKRKRRWFAWLYIVIDAQVGWRWWGLGALPLPLLDTTYELQVVPFGNGHLHTCLSQTQPHHYQNYCPAWILPKILWDSI